MKHVIIFRLSAKRIGRANKLTDEEKKWNNSYENIPEGCQWDAFPPNYEGTRQALELLGQVQLGE